MPAAAKTHTPSAYVSLADTHSACTPANDPLYPHAHHRPPARAPGSKLYEEFHPFGTTAYAANDSGIEVSAKRYRYIGKERDEETGLYHCGARYLAAWLGRWTAPDPIGLGDGVNRYAYSHGNPINLIDPEGTRTEPVGPIRVDLSPGPKQDTPVLVAEPVSEEDQGPPLHIPTTAEMIEQAAEGGPVYDPERGGAWYYRESEEYTGYEFVPDQPIVVLVDTAWQGPEAPPPPQGSELVDELSHTYVEKGEVKFLSREEYELKRQTFLAHVRQANKQRPFVELDASQLETLGRVKLHGSARGPARELLEALRAEIKANPELGVKTVRISSAYRTVEEQLAKWDASYWRKRQSFAPGKSASEVDPARLARRIGGKLGSPGRSKHQSGTAFDISITLNERPKGVSVWETRAGNAINAWLAENVGKFGLSRPVMPKEPWHIAVP